MFRCINTTLFHDDRTLGSYSVKHNDVIEGFMPPPFHEGMYYHSIYNYLKHLFIVLKLILDFITEEAGASCHKLHKCLFSLAVLFNRNMI